HRDTADVVADHAGARVEHGCDVDPMLREDQRARDRLAEPPRADERNVVLALRAQDLPDLRQQRVDRVADSALAELAEVREVAADLRRVDVRVIGDLLRGDPLLPHLAGLRQYLEVAGEPGRDADREPVGSAGRKWTLQHHEALCPRLGDDRSVVTSGAACDAGASGDAEFPAQRSFVDPVDERPLAVDLHRGQPLAIARFEVGVAADVDGLVRLADAVEHVTRALAQMTARRVVEDEAAATGTGHASPWLRRRAAPRGHTPPCASTSRARRASPRSRRTRA